MRRNTGAILRETRPETIITSACRGEARKTSEPKRARSLRPLVAFIISIAQHASPKVAGHSDDFRAQLISESRLVVRTSGSASAKTFSKPITWYAPQARSICTPEACAPSGQAAFDELEASNREFETCLSSNLASASASRRALSLQSNAPFLIT